MTQKLTIIGGGLVGASLACALRPLDLDVTVLEETPLESNAQPSFDERTIALTYGSRKILEAIGIWDLIAPEVGVIKRIHVSNRGHAGSFPTTSPMKRIFIYLSAMRWGLRGMGDESKGLIGQNPIQRDIPAID